MNEQRRKQMMIAGALVAAVALVLVFWVMRHRGGEEAVAPAAPAAGAGTAAGGETGGAGGASVPTGMTMTPASPMAGAPVGAPTGMPGAPGMRPAAGGGTDMGSPMHPPKDAKSPPFKPRPDPFQQFPLPKEWLAYLKRLQTINQPPPVYAWGLPAAAVRTAYVSPGTGPQPLDLRQVQGPRRMSGILFDGRVWAILETEDGQSHVVKPGDVVESGVKVAAVSRDSMVIAQAGRQQNVELKGRPAPASAATPVAAPGAPVAAPSAAESGGFRE